MTSELQIGYNNLKTGSVKVTFEPCWTNYVSSFLGQFDVEKELKENIMPNFYVVEKEHIG